MAKGEANSCKDHPRSTGNCPRLASCIIIWELYIHTGTPDVACSWQSICPASQGNVPCLLNCTHSEPLHSLCLGQLQGGTPGTVIGLYRNTSAIGPIHCPIHGKKCTLQKPVRLCFPACMWKAQLTVFRHQLQSQLAGYDNCIWPTCPSGSGCQYRELHNLRNRHSSSLLGTLSNRNH